jgi:hypothetical protein
MVADAAWTSNLLECGGCRVGQRRGWIAVCFLTTSFLTLETEMYPNLLRTADLPAKPVSLICKGARLSEPQCNALRARCGAPSEGLLYGEVVERPVTRLAEVSRLLDRLQESLRAVHLPSLAEEGGAPRSEPRLQSGPFGEGKPMAGNVRIKELLSYIQEGRIMDAMKEFYAQDVVMEEPMYGKTVGLAANLEREQNFVNSVKEFKSFEAPKVAVGENVSTYENVMDWVDLNGQEIHVEQVSVATWKDGKIVHERFYYDTGNA